VVRGDEAQLRPHLLRFDDDQDALIYEGEYGHRAQMSRRELRAEVARCAAALQRAGVQSGQRVAGFMPNVPETIIAMLAAASLGAVWSSCSPDFGVRGVLDRFGQIEPTVLVVTDGYTYGGKPFETLSRVAEMLPQLPSVRQVIVVPYWHNAGHKQPRIFPASAAPSCGAIFSGRSRARPRRCRSLKSPSTIRSSSCIPPARPACPSASSTATAGRCCST